MYKYVYVYADVIHTLLFLKIISLNFINIYKITIYIPNDVVI